MRSLLVAALITVGPAVTFGQTEPNLKELRSRADAGDADALNALGNAYANGQGVTQDYAAAVRYYTEASVHGHAPAQYNLGMLAELGRGMSADIGAAFRFYLKAAQQGFAPAQFSVGNMYANGMGTAQDYEKAAVWFRQAAERGIAEAQYNLGLALELGRGVAVDEAQAQKWYREAASHDYARARYNLALMLEEGRGSAANPVAAAENYRAAAERGFAPAQTNYGILLAEGRPNVPADLVEGYAWLALAVENGAKPTGRDILAKKLSAAQLASAAERMVALRNQFVHRENPTPAAAIVATTAPSAEVTALAAQLKSADAELTTLRKEREQATETIRALGKEKTAIEEKLAAANATNAQAAAMAARADTLAAQNATLTAQHEATQRQVTQLQADLAVARATQKKPVGDGTETLNQQLAAAQKTVAELTAARTAAAQQTATLRAELADAKAQAKSLEQANAALERGAEAKPTAELNRLRTELASAQRSQSSDHETLTKLTEQLDGAGKTIAELRDQNDDLLKDLEVSKQSTAAALAAQSAAAKAPPETDASKLEMQTLQNRVRALESQVDDERGSAAQEITALAGQLQRSREANRALMDANRALLGNKQADDSAVTAANERLTAKVQALTEENEKFTEQQRLVAENTRLAQEKKAADQAVTAAKLTASAPAGWAQERDNLRAQLEDMFNKLSEAEKRSAQLKQSEEAARLAAQTAGQEASRAQADLAALQTKFAESEKAGDQHSATVAELTGLNERLSTEKASLQAQVARQAQVIEKTRSDLAEFRTRAGSADRLAEETAATIDELKTANQKLLSDAKAANEELANLRSSNERLAGAEQGRTIAEQKAASLAASANQLGAAQRDLTNLRAENARLSENLRTLDRERAARIAQLQQENASVAARLRQAQGTLDQIAAAARVIPTDASPTLVAGRSVQSSSPTAAAPQVRTHTVAEGDSLSRISVRYYGTTNRWQEIYDANRELLRGENALKPGQRLKIP